MTIVRPTPFVAFKHEKHDGPSDQWYRALAALIDQANALSKSFGDSFAALGTAAFKNIGTSGDSVPLLNTANDWSKQQGAPLKTLTDAATIAWDVAEAQSAIVTLGATRVLGAATNTKPGNTYMLGVITGGNGLTFNSMYKFPGGVAPTLAGSSLLSFWCPSSGVLWCVAAKDFS